MMGPNSSSMTGVLIRGEDTVSYQEQSHVTTEAETDVTLLKVKAHQ